MNDDRAARLMELLNDALELDQSARSTFLDEQCGDDNVLREEVESLLKAHEHSGSFLETPITPDEPTHARSLIGKHIGRYKVRDILAVGGMGVVYSAEQRQPQRQVAIKLLRPGIATPRILQRFEHEAEILGQLNHPGIAGVIEAGTFDSGMGAQPFFAMEYIDGQALTEYLRAHQIDVDGRLRLMVGICDAVQHAHLKGIVHRDLKPSNILIDRSGRPRILDFGVARLTDADTARVTMHTETGQLLGTLAYMSPEQVSGIPDQADMRSDVYSLGVVMYEMFTGHVPHEVDRYSIFEAARVIREDLPKPLSHALPQLRREVETIVLKALEKDRERRYQSAGELGADIQRLLDNEPILARAPSTFYLLRTFARRNRPIVAGIAAAVAALLIGLAGTTYGLIQTIEAREQAVRDAERALVAEQEAQQRAEELELIAAFQDGILEHIDPHTFGTSVRELVIGELGHFSDPTDLEATFASANFTNIGREIVRTNFIQPAVDAAGEQFANKPVIRAQLLHRLALSLFNLGLYEDALVVGRDAMTMRRDALGNTHPDTLSSISDVATYLRMLRRFEEALPYYEEAVRGYRQSVGPEHHDTILTLSLRGLTLTGLDRQSEAEATLREAVAMAERHLGRSHAVTARCMTGLADLLHKYGRYADAELYYRSAFEISNDVFGPNHRYTVSHAANLARALQSLGRLDETEEIRREVLAQRRELLGDAHTDTIGTLISLSMLLRAKGELEEAVRTTEQSVSLSREYLGPLHANTLQSRHIHADLLRQMGDWNAAVTEFEKVLDGFNKTLGPNHERTLSTAYFLGASLQQLERFDEAKPHLQHALDGRRDTLGEQHPQTLITQTAMADLHRDLGELDDADRIGADAVATAREVLPDGHWHLGVHLYRHAQTLFAMQNFADAEESLREAHDLLYSTLGAQHLHTISVRETFAELYDAWHAHDPGAGYDAKVAEWRDTLPSKNAAP